MIDWLMDRESTSDWSRVASIAGRRGHFEMGRPRCRFLSKKGKRKKRSEKQKRKPWNAVETEGGH